MTRRREMSDQSAEQELTDYYQAQQLSSDRLQAIMADSQSTSRNRYVGIALAASIAVFSLFAFAHQNILSSHRTNMVLREAALNHTSKLKMDAETASLSELQQNLGELGFEIRLPESEFFKQLALMGGRYCTISGNLAAHIKLSNPETMEQFSLFLTPQVENLNAMKSSVINISGVDVELWQERDVVYAFATGVSQ